MSSTSPAATSPSPLTPCILLVVNIDTHLPSTYAIPESQTALVAKLLPLDGEELDAHAMGGTDEEKEIRRLLWALEPESEDSEDEEVRWESHSKGPGAGVLCRYQVGPKEYAKVQPPFWVTRVVTVGFMLP